MSEGSKPWYESIISPLKRAFARHEYIASRREELGGYLYDESEFAVFTEGCLWDDFDPKKGRSPSGYGSGIGGASFRYVQEPILMGIPFAVDELGKRIRGEFDVEYEDLQFRIRGLEENGIRPTETLRAQRYLDRLIEYKRDNAGLASGRVFQFPDKAV